MWIFDVAMIVKVAHDILELSMWWINGQLVTRSCTESAWFSAWKAHLGIVANSTKAEPEGKMVC